MNQYITLKFLLFICLFLGLTSTTSAQNLHLISKYSEQGVVLRWGPQNEAVWHDMMSKGVFIERAQVPVSIEEIDNYTYERVNTEAIKPKSQTEWELIIDNDEYVAAAWSAIYVEAPENIDQFPGNLKNHDDIKKKRFFLAMLAADHSRDAASAMGMFYIDKDIRENQRYIYRVSFSDGSDSSAALLVDTKQFDATPLPIIPEMRSGEKAVNLSWDHGLQSAFFTSYHIERSLQGANNYSRLTKLPLLNFLGDEEATETPLIYYVDSLQENYVKYDYRIIGITPFADESPASETVVGYGIDLTPPSIPESILMTIEDNARVILNWQKKNPESDFDGYVIGKGASYKGPFEIISSDILPSSTNSFVDSTVQKDIKNYYVVGVIDTAGNMKYTDAKFAFFKDDTPVSVPLGLNGSVDSTGIVTLNWKASADSDVIGYRVYTSNSPDHRFIMRPGKLITDTFYQEKISIHTLSERVLYRIAAVDIGYGHSAQTEDLVLYRPDIIAPSPPVISNYRLSDSSLQIDWIPSYSHDVISHSIYRKSNSGDFIKYADLKTDVLVFVDQDLNEKTKYSYLIRAADDADLFSDASNIITVATGVKPIEFAVEAVVNSKKDRIDVSWNLEDEKDVRFVLYRSINEAPFESIKSISDMAFTETVANGQETFQFAVEGVFANGRKTGLMLSNTVIVK